MVISDLVTSKEIDAESINTETGVVVLMVH